MQLIASVPTSECDYQHGVPGPCRLFEEILVDFLDVKGLLNPAAHVVAYHQAGQMVAIDQDDTLAQIIGCFAVKVEVVTNRPLAALWRSRLPKKSRIAPEPTVLPAA